MGVVIAHGAVHLGPQGHVGQALVSGLQTRAHIGHFFADGGGAGGLTVGAAEHRVIRVAVRQVAQGIDQRLQARQQHLFARGLELQRMAGVIDVFAGAGKVNKFTSFFNFRVISKLVF